MSTSSLGTRGRRPGILLVDQDGHGRRKLGAALAKAGYDVLEAATGEEALKLLAELRVDAAFVAQSLSGWPCPESCRSVRAVPALRELSLIVVMDSDDPAAIVEALDAGADDYVSRSTDLEVLKAKLRVQLRGRSPEMPTSSSKLETDGAPAVTPLELDADALTRLQESVDVEGVIELIDAALADVPRRLAALCAALEKGDAPALVIQAHQLKSSTALFGGTRIAAACAELEQLGRAGRLADSDRAVSALSTRLERFALELREARKQRTGR